MRPARLELRAARAREHGLGDFAVGRASRPRAAADGERRRRLAADGRHRRRSAAARRPPGTRAGCLAFARDAALAAGNLAIGGARSTVGHSARAGRSGCARCGDSALAGQVLVFGCIHGDECAASAARAAAATAAPTPTRQRLRRPQPQSRRPRGGHPTQRARRRPQPQLRLALAADRRAAATPSTRARARSPSPRPGSPRGSIRRCQPAVTIWFHQDHERPLVRAWGPSVPAARALRARSPAMPFRRMPLARGTAPNWQNHRFPGTSCVRGRAAAAGSAARRALALCASSDAGRPRSRRRRGPGAAKIEMARRRSGRCLGG